MTPKQQEILEFIKASPTGKRYLHEFEDIMPTQTNKESHKLAVRAGALGRMVKLGIIKKYTEKRGRHLGSHKTNYYFI